MGWDSAGGAVDCWAAAKITMQANIARKPGNEEGLRKRSVLTCLHRRVWVGLGQAERGLVVCGWRRDILFFSQAVEHFLGEFPQKLKEDPVGPAEAGNVGLISGADVCLC